MNLIKKKEDFTALRFDNVSKNGCSTVYNFWHLLFLHTGHMNIKYFYQNPSSSTLSLQIQLNNTSTRRHRWDQLSWHRASPLSSGKVLQGVPDSSFLISFLPLAFAQAVFHNVAIDHNIVITVAVPIFPPPSSSLSFLLKLGFLNGGGGLRIFFTCHCSPIYVKIS